jgi:hypothetical protein
MIAGHTAVWGWKGKGSDWMEWNNSPGRNVTAAKVNFLYNLLLQRWNGAWALSCGMEWRYYSCVGCWGLWCFWNVVERGTNETKPCNAMESEKGHVPQANSHYICYALHR